MTLRTSLVAIALILRAADMYAQTSPGLCDQIRAITSEPAVVAAHWGVSVTTIDGTPLCGINQAQLFRPASNAKLFTAISALALLGSGHTVVTHIDPRGQRTGDTLTGDLVLSGAGDGFLSERHMPYASPGSPSAATPRVNPLVTLADKIVATGLKHVTGNIIGDDSAWPYEPYPSDWAFDDLLWGYGAPVSALTFDDNKLALTVHSGATAGSPAVVTLDPATPFYTLQSTVTTVAGAAAKIGIERIPGTRTIRIFGTVAIGAPVSEDLAIDDPAEYSALTLRALLVERGIQIDGVAKAEHRYSEVTASVADQASTPIPTHINATEEYPYSLADVTSPTLLDDITVTLKVSQNLHAELILHQLAVARGLNGSTAQGVRVVRQFWLGNGLRTGDFALFDGSGLSGHDLTTPRALTQMLVFAARQPWFAGFKAALPLGGVDGSLMSRFSGPLKGRVFAKTGTLGESRGLSGYVTADSGKTIVFSILVDTHLPGNSTDRTAMDRIVAAIATTQ